MRWRRIVRAPDLFNHRQVELIQHGLKHPFHQYSIAGHKKTNNVVYQTARTDLLDLRKRGVLDGKKRGKAMIFVAPDDLAQRLRQLEKQARK